MPQDATAKPFEGKWEQVTPAAAFSLRDTAEDFVLDGKMWISNGYITGGGLERDLWNSSDGITWSKVLAETPYDGYAEMVVYDGKVWAVKQSVWNSADGVNWTKVLDATPFGVRGYGELVVFQGKMWQLGSGTDVWWTTDGVNWTCALKEAPYGKRYGPAVTVYKDKLWLVGGCVAKAGDPPEKHYKDFTTYNDVWCSEDGVNWTRVLEHAPFEERMWFVGREYAGRLWVFGGFSNRKSVNFAESWYTEDGLTWRKFAPEPHWSPRHEPTIWLFNDAFRLAAGNSWPLTNDVWKIVPAPPAE
jgi:hypothetical protein